MADRHTIRHAAPRSVAVVSPHVALAAMISIAAAPILLAFALVPRVAVLPTHSVTVTPWDVAGALVLIGCAAAMLTEAEHLTELFATIN